MKIYHKLLEFNGLDLAEEVRSGGIYLYADVKCNLCGKEYSLAQVNGIGGKCLRCEGVCY